MSTLKELAAQYRENAARLRIALEDAREELRIAEDTGGDIGLCKDRVSQLISALNQARDLFALCDVYYERPRNPVYSRYYSMNIASDKIDYE